MIINVPTAEDFTRAGCNLLNLAWSQVDGLLAGLSDFEKDTSLESLENVSPGLVPIREAEPETKKERTARHTAYWSAAERELANAIAIAHQGVEFLLKGRIALVSQYLLIVQDPKHWPKPDDNREIDFSLFRAIDAIHLPRICEAVSDQKFPSNFRNEYDRLRRLRNRVMHSVGKLDFDSGDLFWIMRSIHSPWRRCPRNGRLSCRYDGACGLNSLICKPLRASATRSAFYWLITERIV